MRLTPKQKQQLVAVRRSWGHCFGFPPLPLSCTREATAAEVAEYYDEQRRELAALEAKAKAALEAKDWSGVRSLASDAVHLTYLLAEPVDERSQLYCLTSEAMAIADAELSKAG